MTLADALDLVVARTGHRRFRELCDPAHPDYDPGYAQVVIDLATGTPTDEPPAAPPPPSIPLAGDLVAALTARLGADRAAAWIAGKLGTDCGCAARRERLNRLDRTVRRWLRLGD